MKCCLCNKEIVANAIGWDRGNNAEPIKSGRCCDKCNLTKVIVKRIANMKESK